MTDFTKKTFSVAVGSSEYRDNWERIFRGEVEGVFTPKTGRAGVVICQQCERHVETNGAPAYLCNWCATNPIPASEERAGASHFNPRTGFECPYLALGHCDFCNWGKECDAEPVSPLQHAAQQAVEAQAVDGHEGCDGAEGTCSHCMRCNTCGELLG